VSASIEGIGPGKGSAGVDGFGKGAARGIKLMLSRIARPVGVSVGLSKRMMR